MSHDSYSPVVAARAQCAQQILESPDLLARYEDLGGCHEDLELIVAMGRKAQVFSLARTQGAAALDAAQEAAAAFSKLQLEYASVMAAVQAALFDARRARAPEALLARLEKILAEEPELGRSNGRAAKKATPESIRSQIEKHAAGLQLLSDAAPFLARRKVDTARLTALGNAARALKGKLAAKSQGKGKPLISVAESDAVQELKQIWSGCSRLLEGLGDLDQRVRAQLRDTVEHL